MDHCNRLKLTIEDIILLAKDTAHSADQNELFTLYSQMMSMHLKRIGNDKIYELIELASNNIQSEHTIDDGPIVFLGGLVIIHQILQHLRSISSSDTLQQHGQEVLSSIDTLYSHFILNKLIPVFDKTHKFGVSKKICKELIVEALDSTIELGEWFTQLFTTIFLPALTDKSSVYYETSESGLFQSDVVNILHRILKKDIVTFVAPLLLPLFELKNLKLNTKELNVKIIRDISTLLMHNENFNGTTIKNNIWQLVLHKVEINNLLEALLYICVGYEVVMPKNGLGRLDKNNEDLFYSMIQRGLSNATTSKVDETIKYSIYLCKRYTTTVGEDEVRWNRFFLVYDTYLAQSLHLFKPIWKKEMPHLIEEFDGSWLKILVYKGINNEVNGIIRCVIRWLLQFNFEKHSYPFTIRETLEIVTHYMARDGKLFMKLDLGPAIFEFLKAYFNSMSNISQKTDMVLAVIDILYLERNAIFRTATCWFTKWLAQIELASIQLNANVECIQKICEILKVKSSIFSTQARVQTNYIDFICNHFNFVDIAIEFPQFLVLLFDNLLTNRLVQITLNNFIYQEPNTIIVKQIQQLMTNLSHDCDPLSFEETRKNIYVLSFFIPNQAEIGSQLVQQVLNEMSFEEKNLAKSIKLLRGITTLLESAPNNVCTSVYHTLCHRKVEILSFLQWYLSFPTVLDEDKLIESTPLTTAANCKTKFISVRHTAFADFVIDSISVLCRVDMDINSVVLTSLQESMPMFLKMIPKQRNSYTINLIRSSYFYLAAKLSLLECFHNNEKLSMDVLNVMMSNFNYIRLRKPRFAGIDEVDPLHYFNVPDVIFVQELIGLKWEVINRILCTINYPISKDFIENIYELTLDAFTIIPGTICHVIHSIMTIIFDLDKETHYLTSDNYCQALDVAYEQYIAQDSHLLRYNCSIFLSRLLLNYNINKQFVQNKDIQKKVLCLSEKMIQNGTRTIFTLSKEVAENLMNKNEEFPEYLVPFVIRLLMLSREDVYIEKDADQYFNWNFASHFRSLPILEYTPDIENTFPLLTKTVQIAKSILFNGLFYINSINRLDVMVWLTKAVVKFADDQVDPVYFTIINGSIQHTQSLWGLCLVVGIIAQLPLNNDPNVVSKVKEILTILTDSVSFEVVQNVTLRSFLELSLSLLCIKFPMVVRPMMVDFLKQGMKASTSKVRSWIAVASQYMTQCGFDPELVDIILPYQTAQHVSIKTYSQCCYWNAYAMYSEEFEKHNINSTIAKFFLKTEGCMKWIDRYNQHGIEPIYEHLDHALLKPIITMRDEIIEYNIHSSVFTQIVGLNSVQLSNIYDNLCNCQLQRFSSALHQVNKQWTHVPLFSNPDFTMKDLFGIDWRYRSEPYTEEGKLLKLKVLQEPNLYTKLTHVHNSRDAPKVKEDDNETHRDDDTSYQTKIKPWQDEDFFSLNASSSVVRSKQARQPIIMIASLCSKIPNLAGLCRTCEIFNVEKLIMSNVNTVKSDPYFKTMSVTAHHWIDLEEVNQPDLMEYIQKLKDDGYKIVGLEQTSTSISIEKWNVDPNQKYALLLGAEKQGVPTPLLNLVDHIIEIPQFGMIRSLNVHVSGSILLYELTRQMLVLKQSEEKILNK